MYLFKRWKKHTHVETKCTRTKYQKVKGDQVTVTRLYENSKLVPTLGVLIKKFRIVRYRGVRFATAILEPTYPLQFKISTIWYRNKHLWILL